MNSGAQYICKHGSLWCGVCRHNIYQFSRHDASAGHMTLMGRPKYPPRHVKAKGRKPKKSENKGQAARGGAGV